MDHQPLGNTGLLVSRLDLGTMTMGSGTGVYTSIGNVGQTAADGLIKEEKMGLLVWSPLAGGWLSGKFSREN